MLETLAGSLDAEGAEALARKIRRKFWIRRVVGELYVGKRMKMKYLRRVLPEVRLAPRHSAHLRLLEVGSEDGAFTDFIARCYPTAIVEGMELRGDWAAACTAWAAGRRDRTQRLSFRQGDILQLTEPQKYDAIFCLDVLGYISDDRRAVANLTRALVPGGLLIVHQPNRIYREFNGTTHRVSDAEAGRIISGHVRHGYTAEELRSLLEASGLTVERVLPLHGKYSDLAHRLHRRLERPAVLRFLALPLIDFLWWRDARHMLRPDAALAEGHGNTLLAMARKSASPFPEAAP